MPKRPPSDSHDKERIEAFRRFRETWIFSDAQYATIAAAGGLTMSRKLRRNVYRAAEEYLGWRHFERRSKKSLIRAQFIDLMKAAHRLEKQLEPLSTDAKYYVELGSRIVRRDHEANGMLKRIPGTPAPVYMVETRSARMTHRMEVSACLTNPTAVYPISFLRCSIERAVAALDDEIKRGSRFIPVDIFLLHLAPSFGLPLTFTTGVGEREGEVSGPLIQLAEAILVEIASLEEPEFGLPDPQVALSRSGLKKAIQRAKRLGKALEQEPKRPLGAP